jgi:oligosaccharide repeat unit polymerase
MTRLIANARRRFAPWLAPTVDKGTGQPARAARPARPAQLRRGADLWWLHPSVVVAGVLLPIYLMVQFYDFGAVVPVVYVPGMNYWFGALMLVALLVGIQWALSNRQQGPARRPPHISLTVMMLLLAPTLMAYTVWFGPLLLRPDLLMEIVNGERRELRDDISTVKGVTTFTQFGMAYVIAYAIKSGAGIQRVHRIEHLGFAVVFLLAIFRAFAWAERLAVLELLVSFTVTRMAYLPITTQRGWRLANVLPALAPFVLYGVFTASEYFRSWEHYQDRYDTVWAFTLDRLIAYYATAANNGIGVLVESSDWPYYSGAFFFESLWLMPGMNPILDGAFGNPRGIELWWINTYGRPEFNSPTAYFRTVLDLGYFGSVVLYIALGFMIGRAYAGLRRGHVFGLLMYGAFFMHLIESLRYGYLGETRCVPLLLGLAIVALDIRRNRHKVAGTT